MFPEEWNSYVDTQHNWITMTRKPPSHATGRWWRVKMPVCLTNQLPLDLTAHLFYINQNSKRSGPILAAYIFMPKFYLESDLRSNTVDR